MAQYAYLRIADALLQRIRAREWRVGDRLPALSELERQYPESRMTLYNALRHLAEQGYVTISERRGTFVKATHVHRRICILAGAGILGPAASPFVFQAFRQANALLTARGFDAQLYTEDPLQEHRLPTGLVAEVEARQFAGVLTIETYPLRPFWQQQFAKTPSLPWVHLGSLQKHDAPAPHHLYVDRDAFVDQALALAKQAGRRRVLLLEREEHLSGDLPTFLRRCAAHGLASCLYPPVMPQRTLDYEQYGFDALHRIWAEADRPDAVIVPDDVIAKGVTQAAPVLGIRVPEQLQIIVLANRGIRVFYPVPVTKLDVDVEALVTRAVNLLVELIAGSDVPPRTIWEPPLPVSLDREGV